MAFLLCLACTAIACEDGPREAPSQAAIDVVSALETVITDVIAATEGSVVAIHRDKAEDAGETLAVRGRLRTGVAEGVGDRARLVRPTQDVAISFDFGSGVVIGDDGEILTAFHVVQGARRLIVRAVDRQEFDAEVIAADPRSDLAVIVPVAGPGLKPPRLKPLPIGDAGSLRKGIFLIALGNPFNSAMQDGRASAGWGILSNVARRVQYDPMVWSGGDPRGRQLPHQPSLLQLDSKLSLGMSGGAVVNLRGELVGLTTTAASPAGYDAMAGYAFPMDAVGRRAVETLKQGKEVEYGLLGIIQNDGDLARREPNRIDRVSENSPAAQGELQIGDLFIAVDDVPVHDFSSLLVAVSPYAPGDKIRLKIVRGGREMEKTLTIAKYPVKGEVIATVRPPAWRGLRVDHRSLLAGAPLQAPFVAVGPELRGVVVREVEPGSPAAKADLRPWMSIHEVAGRPVDVPADFVKAVADLKGPVLLMTDRGPITVEP